jgi:phage gpG-like protein
MEPIIIDVKHSVTKEAVRLDAVAKQAQNFTTVMERIYLDILKIEHVMFRSQGRRGGGSWARLKPDTVRKKGDWFILRTDRANPGYSKIGKSNSVDTLYNSVTKPNAAYQIWRIEKNALLFGTARPYAGVHQYGSSKRHIPARPFLRFLDTDVRRWDDWMLFHVVKPHMSE